MTDFEELEELIASCIELQEESRHAEVDALLARHPEIADEAKRVLASLHDLGMVADAPADDGLFTDRIGEFELVKRLGQGGMGIVFLARQESVNRLVALKIVNPVLAADPRMVERFRREAQAVAKLQHPNIVTLYASGEDQGLLYTAMELVPGHGLDELLERSGEGRPSLRQAVEWSRDIARGLARAHEVGVIHRDVKPSNIRVTKDGYAKLLDFGLAREVGSRTLTLTGTFQGSPQYASPEQIRAGGAIGPATDIYSLGVTMFEAACGMLPFAGETTDQVFHDVLTRELPNPRSLNSDVPRDLATIIQKCVEKSPSDRYASAGALADDLDAFLALRRIEAKPPGAIEHVRKFTRRHKALVAGLVAVIVALTAGVIATYWQYREARQQASTAEAVNDFLMNILAVANPDDAGQGKDFTVLQALDRAAVRVPELAGQPRVEADVRHMIGNAYRALDALDAAEPHLRRALELRVSNLGERDEEVAKAVHSLGILENARGKHAEALALFRRGLAISEGLHGERHEEVAIAQVNVGSSLLKLQRFDEAERVLEKAAAWFRELQGERRAMHATVLDYLATIANRKRDRPRQIELLREAVEVYAQTDRAQHPFCGIAHINLGSALRRSRSFRDAEIYLKRAAQIFEHHYAEKHPYRRAVKGELAKLYREWRKGGDDK